LKRISIFIAIILMALGAASRAISFAQQNQQQKPRQKKPSSRVRPRPTPTPLPDLRKEASDIATQIKNVSNFIYVYGKIVNSLEVADEQVKNKQTSPEIQAKNQKSKDALILRMSDLRAGLENVAKSFQANPRMQVQYLKLTYATDAVLNAQRLAVAGKYDEAGKLLITSVERLTDTMVSMRLL